MTLLEAHWKAQIFFPHSITREVGSSHAFRIPTSAPPNYYSEPHISSPRKIVQSMPETRMDSFHFPDTSDLNSLRSSRYHSNSPFSQRNSADHYGDMSPGYEADAERIEMPSFPIPSKLPGSASMVPSLNNMMWDYEFEPGSSLRRRHSDSYFHSRRWKFSAHATAWFQEESRSHLSTSLHPYVSVRLPYGSGCIPAPILGVKLYITYWPGGWPQWTWRLRLVDMDFLCLLWSLLYCSVIHYLPASKTFTYI